MLRTLALFALCLGVAAALPCQPDANGTCAVTQGPTDIVVQRGPHDTQVNTTQCDVNRFLDDYDQEGESICAYEGFIAKVGPCFTSSTTATNGLSISTTDRQYNTGFWPSAFSVAFKLIDRNDTLRAVLFSDGDRIGSTIIDPNTIGNTDPARFATMLDSGLNPVGKENKLYAPRNASVPCDGYDHIFQDNLRIPCTNNVATIGYTTAECSGRINRANIYVHATNGSHAHVALNLFRCNQPVPVQSSIVTADFVAHVPLQRVRNDGTKIYAFELSVQNGADCKAELFRSDDPAAQPCLDDACNYFPQVTPKDPLFPNINF